MSKDDVIKQAFHSAMGFFLGGALLMMSLPVNYHMRYKPMNAGMFWVSIFILVGLFCFYVYLVYDVYKDYKKSEAKKNDKSKAKFKFKSK